MDEDRTAAALEAFDDVVAEVVEEFPKHDREAATDGWGPREVMAHFLAWHTWWAETAEALAAGRTPPSLGAGIEETNARAAAGAGDQPMQAMAEQLKALHHRLHAAVKAMPKPETVLWPRLGNPSVPTSERLRGMAGHLRGHLDELRAGGTLSR
jgi:hypothetical protein